jgi:acyl-CoA thioester hydrolase
MATSPSDTKFEFYHPIEVRYGDLDPQGHVNNAKYLTYFEQARISYIRHLGLWKGGAFFDIGFILADVRITFHTPVTYRQPIRVGVRVTRLGNKSLTMEYSLEDSQTLQVLANGSSVLVAYDYKVGQTIPIPGDWRQAISTIESIAE